MSGGYSRPTARGVCSVPSELTGGASGQIQNVKATRVYVFGDADMAEDELENQVAGLNHEMSELRARGRARKQQNDYINATGVADQNSEETFFEKAISEGETLQNLALKYGCQVSELKRINNLIQDQDFYGLKVLKIPHLRHGLLSELHHGQAQVDQQQAGSSMSGTVAHAATVNLGYEANENDDDSNSESQQLLVRTLSIRDSLQLGHQGKAAVDFLKKMDSDIQSIIESTNSQKDTLEEVRDTLTCKRIHPLFQRKSFLDGADCGMRWWSAVILMLVLGFLIPLLYLLYFEVIKPDS